MGSTSSNRRLRVNQPVLDQLGPDKLLDFDAVMDRRDGVGIKTKLTDRQVHRLTLSDGKTYFLKRTFSVSFGNAVKNRFFGMGCHSRPGCEWAALMKMRDLGVPAPVPVVCGEEYAMASVRRAYLVTQGLPVEMSLEELVQQGGKADGQLLNMDAIAQQVARHLSTMHQGGLNHRDFYLGHLFLGRDLETVYVMDLDRAHCRRYVSQRWRVKDLAALHFSTPASAFSWRRRLRFLRTYLGGSLKGATELLRQIEAKAAKIRAHVEGRVARGKPNFHLPD